MLDICHVKKEYRTGGLTQRALDDVTLSFREREFVAILGPSGSGKTTLLNIIGGLDRYDSGEMSIRDVPTSEYGDRDWDTYRNHTVGFIFQSYNLIPHQTLLSNVELAMTLSGVGKDERRTRAEEALDRVGLLDQARKKPDQLSGGQMQRVAIARALVNRPSVLLADEPTGALDSDTGEQVMELLKEVSKDHLVIMVTHNPDLAERYATRIIRLRDGKVTDDTDPYQKEEVPSTESKTEGKAERVRKSSMSFLTAMSLSVSNLLSKKARTILVAFATSIGIIGVALILSFSTGANIYIEKTERESLSQYPIQIMSSAFSMEDTMLSYAAMRSEAGENSADEVSELQMMGGMMAASKVNDLASLKRWLDSGESGMEDYSRGIGYTYGIIPQIYLMENDSYRQVNPDQTMAAFGLDMSDNLSQTLSTYNASEVFYALPENSSLYENDYNVLAGRWPEKDTDCVLVLTGSGGIPDFLLYTMGLKDVSVLNSQIEGIVSGSKTTDTTLQASAVYEPEEFLGITFRLLPAFDTFAYDEKLGLWLDKSSDEAFMMNALEDAEEMQIVGVVQPREGVNFGILEMGIDYPAGLQARLMSQADGSEIVKAQRESPETDILTGIPFGESAEDAGSSLANLITIHPEHLTDAVSFRWDRLDDLETDDTRLTAKRTVKILRELSRYGKSDTLNEMLESCIPLLMDLIEIDEDRIGDLISFEMDEAMMQEMYAARAASMSATLESNLARFGYADPASPMAVTIYPNDFEGKEEVVRILDAYNDVMEENGYEDKVISYTDYVAVLTSSVTTIIDVITYVLIAFVAVSLIVSSIMIGIITYISVLERRKEIGVLRAMGASKRNIAEVFNAETFIIGLLAGTIGILATLLLHIPINYLITTVTDQDVYAYLPARSGVILIILCVALTVIGGFIPSRKAARQDPVAALRSE